MFYAINNALDTVILKPASEVVQVRAAGPVRTGIHNFLGNLGTPVQLSNDMLEGKPRRAGDTTMRFLINTHGGGAGLLRRRQGIGATRTTMPISA